MHPGLLYQLALTLVPNIGDVQAKLLVQHYGSATAIFKARRKDLEKLEGIGAVRAGSTKGLTISLRPKKSWPLLKSTRSVLSF